jgi:hypothetical protein
MRCQTVRTEGAESSDLWKRLFGKKERGAGPGQRLPFDSLKAKKLAPCTVAVAVWPEQSFTSNRTLVAAPPMAESLNPPSRYWPGCRIGPIKIEVESAASQRRLGVVFDYELDGLVEPIGAAPQRSQPALRTRLESSRDRFILSR